MVQNINWSSYSANQIIELKQQGVQVPDDVYKKAQEEMQAEVNKTSDDNTATSYTIKDTSGQKNEAKELRAQLEAEGASLKSMVKTFTEKSTEATTQLEDAMKQIEGFTSLISVDQTSLELIKAGAEDEQQVVMEIVKDTQEQVAAKKDEFDFLNKKIENGTATEAETAKAETVGEEINGIVDNGNDAIASKQSVVSSMDAKTQAIQNKMNDKFKQTGDAYVQAKDAKELSKETYDLGNKLYKKGKKTQKIAMAVGALAGGVGGFFAGQAVGNKLNTKLNDKHIMNNLLFEMGSQKAGAGLYTFVNGYGSTAEIAQNYASYSKKHDLNNYGSKAIGTLAGAGIGVAVGSFFGKGDISTGQAGMQAAKVLEATANTAIKSAEDIMSKNKIAIQITNETEVSVKDLNVKVSDGKTEVNGEGVETTPTTDKTVVTPQNGDTPSISTTNNEDDPNKKKPQV